MREMVDSITSQRCVIFGGAGISCDAGLPNWQGLAQRLSTELQKEGKLKAEHCVLIDALLKNNDAGPAIDFIVNNSRRVDVVNVLRTVLVPSRPSKICELIGKLRTRGIVTTNYDRVLDPALSSQQYRLTNSLEKLKQVPIALASKHGFVLKLHGDIDDGLDPADSAVGRGAPFMVLSKGDYAALVQGERLNALIAALHAISLDNSLLFLGYSFRDPDVTWLFRFLSEYCQFPNPSWYIGLQGEALPSLPNNVKGVQALTTWDDLEAWLYALDKEVVASRSKMKSRQAVQEPPVQPVMSPEQRRAFLAMGRYFADLESDDLAERVLSSAVLEDLSAEDEFSFDWLTERIAKLIEVGPSLAGALAKATATYLTGLRMLESLPNGRIRVVKSVVDTLRSRALREWEKNRSSFYASIARRLGVGNDPIPPHFADALDLVLQDLCIDFGEVMAEWVHRGVGREIGWQHARHAHSLVTSRLKDREDRRKANSVLDLVFSQPSEQEVDYLYKLLGAAFLANSVRLDPSAASAVKTTLSNYELFLDTNVLLPVVIEEHPDHPAKKAIIEESRDAGVKLRLIEPIFHEIRGHRDLADRFISDCNGDQPALYEVVDSFGGRANCFLQGFVRVLRAEESSGQPAKPSSLSVSWRQYRAAYADAKLRERLEQLGLSVVEYHENRECSIEYGPILNAITQQWERRIRGRYERPQVLNENEARQFCHIYARREELRANGGIPQVWFLSHETVLADVFEQNPVKWGTPPTFPFSAWVAFLDSRLPWEPKNPSAIVNAILKGNSLTFELPDPIDLVRKKAFGDRVTTKAEEDAVQLALSGFELVTRVEKSRNAILARGDNIGERTREAGQARKAAVGEISSALNETILRLEHQLAKQRQELQEAQAKLKQQQEESQQIVKGQKLPRPPKPHRRRK
ncbi:MAG: SIR2 family protein [Chloroflexi bacterium]|nr:SIR2 family protein [Chloroflexota bacterium]